MEEKRLVTFLLFSVLIAFLVIGAGSMILNYFSMAEYNLALPYSTPMDQWPTAEFVDDIRKLLLIGFMFVLLGLIVVLLFLIIDVVLTSENEKLKGYIQLSCCLAIFVVIIGLIIIFNQMTSDIPTRMIGGEVVYYYYPYSFAIGAQGQLFTPIVCLAAISITAVPLSINKILKAGKNNLDVDPKENL